MTNINHHLLLPVEATEVKSRCQLASNMKVSFSSNCTSQHLKDPCKSCNFPWVRSEKQHKFGYKHIHCSQHVAST